MDRVSENKKDLAFLPSVPWHCWLGVRKSIQPVRTWVMRCWRGYLSGARCKWFACGPAYATDTRSSLASLRSRMVFWCWFTQLVLEKRPLNGCCAFLGHGVDGEADDGCASTRIDSSFRQQTLLSTDGTESTRPTVPARWPRHGWLSAGHQRHRSCSLIHCMFSSPHLQSTRRSGLMVWVSNTDIAVRWPKSPHRYWNSRAVRDHTVLPATRHDIPAFTPAEAGTLFSDPGGMRGWVDLVGWLHTVMVYPPKDSHPLQY